MSAADENGPVLFQIDENLRELIPHFVVHQFEELEIMEAALNNNDLKEVGRLGHSLKGAAANFGLEPLCRLGATIYDVASLGMVNALVPLVKKYNTYLDELKKQVS